MSSHWASSGCAVQAIETRSPLAHARAGVFITIPFEITTDLSQGNMTFVTKVFTFVTRFNCEKPPQSWQISLFWLPIFHGVALLSVVTSSVSATSDSKFEPEAAE
ncbi:MAG TPA: hypothetical protein VH518_01505 [Tepidisphaeraceae bacterium]|jgi:hypothetical protein